MPCGTADSTAQQCEPAIQAVGDLPDAQRGYTCRGQLQCQRDAIQAVADGPQRGNVGLGDYQTGPGGTGPIREQGYGSEPFHLVEGEPTFGPGKCERWYSPDDLARQSQGLPAGRKDP